MSSTRSVKSPGVWGADASTSIPASPLAGVSYRNTGITSGQTRGGWPFDTLVDSAKFNEMLYRYTSLLDVIDRQGVLGWSNQVDYTVPALAWGSDGALYRCLLASGPGSTVRDPVSAPAGYWEPLPTASGDVGDVKYAARSTPPAGWLKANGAAVSRTTYAALFSVIGTTYGAGDGASTFNLPDLRGIFMRGLDDGRGIDPGRALGSYQDHQSNSLAAVDQSPQVYSGGGQNVPTDGNYTGWISTGEEGVQPNQALRFRLAGVETRPRNVALLAVIKY